MSKYNSRGDVDGVLELLMYTNFSDFVDQEMTKRGFVIEEFLDVEVEIDFETNTMIVEVFTRVLDGSQFGKEGTFTFTIDRRDVVGVKSTIEVRPKLTLCQDLKTK